MSHRRILEINYETPPVLGDVALYDGSGWIPSNLLALVSAWLPPGVVVMDISDTPPDGWLICNGQAVSRTTYSALYARIGDTFGSGDGSTTFNVPDIRQKFPLGKAASGTGATLADAGGEIDHAHTVPAHYHGMGTGADLNIESSGAHSHDALRSDSIDGVLGAIVSAQTSASTLGYSVDSNGSDHTHTAGDIAGRIGLVTGGVDGNAEMESGANNPPFLVLNFIIWTGTEVEASTSGRLMGILGLTYP